MAGFDHKAIEKKAQEKWAALKLFETDLATSEKEPYYLLVEFPYPSGDLHIGHWYAFAIPDIYARIQRMRGKNVLFPIGFDAFGLPAENAAIKNGVDPNVWTLANIERMHGQLKSMGASFDWSKQVIACDPAYYHWTQWLFAKLFEHDLAERREASVKWCPKDQTVLANEQVIDGRCERCGTEVVEKILTQWFLKITEYAERLLTDLEPLPWREEIKDAQRAWIGKSEGAKLDFTLVFKKNPADNDWRDEDGKPAHLTVFTTRPDTVYGATYVVIAPDHPWMTLAYEKHADALDNADEIRAYAKQAQSKTERERSENKDKSGVELKGVKVINPATKGEIPIYVADYVIGSYGTGAVMAVPAHDERDHEFAKKFNLPIKTVVTPPAGAELPYTGAGFLENSDAFNQKSNTEAMADIVAAVGGEKTSQYRLRDWLVSRQRYWGCPIPIVYDPEGKPHVIPAEHLPWLLPTDVDFKPTGKASPLASSKELQERVTSIFGEGWTPEYDTLDTFVDSSWYFTRYLDPKDEHDFSDQSLMKKWLPVNRYSGGSEHTTMHLLYARFFIKALYDLALVPVSEPFHERFNRGIILGPDGQKMSKSKGNVINPDEMVGKYGADAVRIYLAFIGPYNEPGSYPWNLDGAASMRKFLDRIVRLAEKVSATEIPETIKRSLAKAGKKVAEDSDRFKFNTAIAALMSLLNELEALPSVPKDALKQYVLMLSPFAPHIAEQLYEQLGETGPAAAASWPVADESLLVDATSEVIVQIAGKKRGSMTLAANASQDEALAEALKLPAIASALAGAAPKRVIYVPGRILNLVP
jgi:leucyl-tRNA synthetase